MKPEVKHPVETIEVSANLLPAPEGATETMKTLCLVALIIIIFSILGFKAYVSIKSELTGLKSQISTIQIQTAGLYAEAADLKIIKKNPRLREKR